MASKPGRVLLVDATAREQCFPSATVREVGNASREHWYLVSGQASPECVEQGRTDAAIEYTPPATAAH
jgi:hypothetical protein